MIYYSLITYWFTTWLNKIILFADNCSNPPVYSGLPAPTYENTTYGSEASYDCSYGYNPDSFPTVSVCNITGWSNIATFTCDAIGKWVIVA